MSMPSVKTLEAAFPTKGKVLRQLLTSMKAVDDHPAVKEWVAKCHHQPANHERRMAALNAVLECYGVEYAKGNGTQRSPSFEYCDTGDTYAVTIVRFEDGRYRVTDWGSIVERGNYQ